MLDERMTTMIAEKALIRGGMRRENRKSTVDKVAAAVILQQWLDQQGTMEKEKNNKEKCEGKDMEIQNTVVELVDENGEETSFEHLMTIEHEDEYYIILLPVEIDEEDEDEEEEVEVVILKIEKDDQGEDSYVSVEDEKILDAVFAKFFEIIEEEEFEDA